MSDEKLDNLLERVFMFLRDGEWAKADEYCEKVLDIDLKNAEAYLGKLMAENKINNRKSLKHCNKPLEQSKNYQKILAFGNANLREEIIAANESSNNLYSIKNKKTKNIIIKSAIFGVPAVAVIVIISIVLSLVVFPEIKRKQRYEDALGYIDDGEIQNAICVLEELGDYKDSEKRVDNLRYDFAVRKTISAGNEHTVAVNSDGTVEVSGEYRELFVFEGRPEYVEYKLDGWTDIIAVSAGTTHTAGLKSDGTVVAEYHCSCDYSGQCDVDDWTDIIAVSAGSNHTVGLKSDGTVVATECYSAYRGQCEVEDWENIIAVSAGGSQTIGLKADGTVVTTKYIKEDNYADGPDRGQFDVENWKNIAAISAGSGHCAGLKDDGTVVAAGANDYGQCDVEYWRDIVAISAGVTHTVGLKADGTVVAVGENDDGQCNVRGWRDIVAVSAGRGYTVGLKSDGTVVAVGDSSNSRCKVDDWSNIKLPSSAE